MFTAHYQLDNLCLYVDFNGLQIDGPVTEVMNPTPHDEKFRAFGWNVIKISAHDYAQILSALEAAKLCKDRPTAIVAASVKGKGVSFMENNAAWHGKAPNEVQFASAMAELNAKLEEVKANG